MEQMNTELATTFCERVLETEVGPRDGLILSFATRLLQCDPMRWQGLLF